MAWLFSLPYGMDDSFGILRGGLACREGMDILASFGVADETKSVTLLGGHLTPKSCKYDQMLP